LSYYEKLIHVDLYNIEDTEEFKHLGLEEYVKPGNVMVVEWGEKLGDVYDEFKKKAKFIYINIVYKTEEYREITIQS
jgi:tRNA A37 threonylcarbamoyladenosine biosynthesis protein TsaE